MKYCKFCKVNKPLEQFVKHPKTIDGYNNKCKQCVKEYRQSYNKLNHSYFIHFRLGDYLTSGDLYKFDKDSFQKSFYSSLTLF